MRRDPDLLLCVSTVAAIVGVSWLLASAGPPATARTGAGENEPIGTVVRLRGKVRVHGRSTLVWSDVRGEEPVHRGDSIYAGPDTAAYVRLADGTVLHTDPGTFLVLADARGDRTRLHVSRGRVSAEAGRTSVEISSPSSTTELGPSGRASVRVTGRRTRVEALSAATVRGLGGSRRLEAAHAIDLDEIGSVKAVTALPVSLDSPADGAIVRVSSLAVPVDLRLATPSAKPVRIEISGDAAFESLVQTASAARHFPFHASREGAFAWRAVGAAGKPVSETRRFTVVIDRPPRPALPRGDEVVYVPEGARLTLHVTRTVADQPLRLEIAGDPSFRAPVLATDVNGDRAAFEPPPGEAQWHWRVREAREGAPWSETETFRVSRTKADRAPDLLEAVLELDP